MSKPSFLRHSGWLSQSMINQPIVVIGCGAVGSTVALLAAKMGVKEFILFDHDIVESHNLPNQQYLPKDIGSLKVDALSRTLKEFNPEIKIQTFDKKFLSSADTDVVKGVLVIATDSISSRKDIYKTFAGNINISLVLEASLGFEHGEIHIIDPLNIEQCNLWLNNMSSDELLPDGPCNLRLAATLVTNISSVLVQYLCSYFVAKSNSKPFEYSYGTLIVMKEQMLVTKQHTKKIKEL